MQTIAPERLGGWGPSLLRVALGPRPPHPFDRACRIHQHTVKIEQNDFTLEPVHRTLPTVHRTLPILRIATQKSLLPRLVFSTIS